jgi:dolichol-phosphate mannosyltransferase
MSALVVLPTYNEAENIVDVLERVRKAVPDADILVVDDGSPDGTADLAHREGDRLGQIEIMHRPEKRGLGAAYTAGFTWGLDRGYEVIVSMDADLSHDPDVVPDLIAALEEGADLAIGSRWVRGGAVIDWPRSRLAISRIGNWYARTMLRLPYRDSTAGFRAYRAALLRQIDVHGLRASGYAFQVELTYRSHQLGARVVELPIIFHERARGVSKMSWRIVGEALTLVTVWGLRDQLRSLRGLRRRATRPAR